jgi:hypothetical protein
MKTIVPSNEALRRKGRVIDQRQQQIDPAGHHRADPNDAGGKRSQKQPGQDLRDPPGQGGTGDVSGPGARSRDGEGVGHGR